MPKRSDRPVRRARVIVKPDGSCTYDRRDYGPCGITKDGQAVMGFTTGGYGPHVMLTVATQTPSLVLATGGKGAKPGHRRRFKGAKAGSVPHSKKKHPELDALFTQRAHLQILIVWGKASKAQYEQYRNLDAKLAHFLPDWFRPDSHEMLREHARLRCEIGRARAAGIMIFDDDVANLLAPVPYIPYAQTTRRDTPHDDNYVYQGRTMHQAPR